MAGDNTLCSPLIRPPLGECVCVLLCVFQALICINSPCTALYESPHSQWGIEGKKKREPGLRTERGKEEGEGKILFRAKLTDYQGHGGDSLLLEQNQFCPWEDWHRQPVTAPFFSFPFEIRPVQGQSDKAVSCGKSLRLKRMTERASESRPTCRTRTRPFPSSLSVHQVTGRVKPVSSTWRLERDSAEALSAAPTGGPWVPHLGQTHCCTRGADIGKESQNFQIKWQSE